MKSHFFLVSIFALVFLSSGCKDDDQPHSDCWTDRNGNAQLKLTVLEGPTISLPAKVSIFFKVQDENNNPVGYLTEENFAIFEKGLNDDCHRIISEFEAERKISGREQVFNHTTILVLDLSGSVLDQSLTQLQDAANAFIDEIMPDSAVESTKMGIFWFDGEDVLHELVAVTPDKAALTAGIGSIFPGMSQDNSTDFYGAVIKASDMANDILGAYQAQNITAAASVVFFTDGHDRANRYLKQDAYNAVNATPQSVTWFTCGVGGEIEEDILTKVGKNGFFPVATVNQLSSVFSQIAKLVNNEANSYYLFEYCSPIRNGANNGLIIEAYDGNDAGHIEATFDATGFTFGCQL